MRILHRTALRKIAFAALLAAAVVSSASAQQTERAKRLGGKMFCVCGCNQILTECNHVGCTYSHKMLAEMDDLVARNESDDLTIQAFVQEYGPAVLTEPPAKGFNVMMWILPVVAVAAGLLILKIVLSQWRRAEAPAASGIPAKWLDRVRNEAGDEHDV